MFAKISQVVLVGLIASIFGIPLISGCSMAPTYERPVVALPATLGQVQPVSSATAVTPAALNEPEREFLRAFAPDRDLGPLVERALTHNADYRLAALQVDRARAQYHIERSARLPTAGVQAQQLRQRFDNPVLDERYQQNVIGAGVGIDNYELDFFGRMKSLSDAARARYLASDAGRETARGALIAEVLRAYALDCAAAQASRHLQVVDADSAALLAIAERQANVGLLSSNEVDRRRAQADRAHVAALQGIDDARAKRRALQFLAGYDLDVVPGALSPLAEAPTTRMALRELDSQALLQRPDIRQAEAQLRAANADIGAARAAFFPSIRLSTSLGTASGSLDGLFESGSRTWSFMPQLVLPIFDFGRNRANLDLAWNRKQAGVAQYEKSIEAAFREVADALDARETLAAAEVGLRQQDRLAALRVERAGHRASEGLEDRTDLLADRIDATQTALDHMQVQRNLALNRIALFLAFYGVALPTSL